LEEFEENPFLEEFYRDPQRFAFQTQLFFLLSRFKQQEKIIQYDLFQQSLISDYMFYKDRIFATLNLNDKELALYNMLANILEKRIVRPDLAIYLRASTDRLMHNITKRNRPYEKHIQRDYIESLNKLYEEFFRNFQATPLLIINTEYSDFVNNPSHLNQIFAEISKHSMGRRVVQLAT
ncbi:deoxynucleoside kinase, partial [Candidatus Saccharibacteria bacterium]|nr:deoxynucleoside kinase [Candidatus Saccharibacteria bacterium]NIV72463.1 deoxynucleoside kinase [Calditrichia bacterium]NIW78743.1 deoxynucleoside kinase [Calditrichia bacterium]